MSQNQDLEERRRRKARREARRRRERRRKLIMRAVFLVLLIVVLFGIITLARKLTRKVDGGQTESAVSNTQTNSAVTDVNGSTQTNEGSTSTAPVVQNVTKDPQTKEEVLDYARYQAMQYDYDGAIATIQGFDGYDTDAELSSELASITACSGRCIYDPTCLLAFSDQ